jgi:membrane protease YdiL (CAAX protease family)
MFMLSPLWLSIVSVALISLVLIITSLRKVPGIGIFFAIAVILVILWITHSKPSILGFTSPASWGRTVLTALICSVVIYLFTTLVLEPLLQRWTHKPLDYSAFDKIQKDWGQLVLLLAVSWLLASILEETIFRGFLITEISSWFHGSVTGIILSILIGSVIFGLAHTYQGVSGIFSTGLVGAALAGIFVFGEYNLWLVILTHGFIDTIGLILMFFKIDQKMVDFLWKKPKKV